MINRILCMRFHLFLFKEDDTSFTSDLYIEKMINSTDSIHGSETNDMRSHFLIFKVEN